MAIGLRALFPLWLLLAVGARPAEAVDFIESETAEATLELKVIVPPTISASASASTVDGGGTVELTATASDPDGGDVTVAWAAPHGTFDSATGTTVDWTAPRRTVHIP